MEENLKTLENGDQMTAQDVDLLHTEAWATLGELQRSHASPSRIQAAADRVSLLNQVKFRGFEASGQQLHRDRDAHDPSVGEIVHPELDRAIAEARKAFRSNPTEVNKEKITQLQRKKYGG
jgi:hypothetical protein